MSTSKSSFAKTFKIETLMKMILKMLSQYDFLNFLIVIVLDSSSAEYICIYLKLLICFFFKPGTFFLQIFLINKAIFSTSTRYSAINLE